MDIEDNVEKLEIAEDFSCNRVALMINLATKHNSLYCKRNLMIWEAQKNLVTLKQSERCDIES